MVVCLFFAVTTVLDTPFPVWYNDVDYTPVTPGSEADLTMVSALIATCVSCRVGAIKWFIYVLFFLQASIIPRTFQYNMVVRVPPTTIRIRPGITEELKHGWIQYVSFLVITVAVGTFTHTTN
jgi:hypothetical protein